jgi:hypothetical protein
MPIDLKALARVGAAARLRELMAEVDEIRRAFPELGQVRQRRDRAEGGRARPAARRGRRKMSAAERKAVSARMKRYWAARRKAKGEKRA